MTDQPIPAVLRVLVVDDHPLMLEALCDAITDEPDLALVGSATDGLEAIALAAQLRPDVTVMDLFLPGVGGVEAAATILDRYPAARILALTSSAEDVLVKAAIQAGVHGYVLKEEGRTEILQAIRAVGQGNAFFSAKIATKVTSQLRELERLGGRQPIEALTERERAILQFVGQGASNVEIAAQLDLQGSTVRTHLMNLQRKLGLENRNQALLYAIRTGLAEP